MKGTAPYLFNMKDALSVTEVFEYPFQIWPTGRTDLKETVLDEPGLQAAVAQVSKLSQDGSFVMSNNFGEKSFFDKWVPQPKTEWD